MPDGGKHRKIFPSGKKGTKEVETDLCALAAALVLLERRQEQQALAAGGSLGEQKGRTNRKQCAPGVKWLVTAPLRLQTGGIKL